MEGTSVVKKRGSKALKALFITLGVCAALFLVGFICCTFIW